MPIPPGLPARLRDWIARLTAAMTVAYTVVLILATHYPRPEELLGKNAPSDKMLHVLAYGLLALLAAGSLALAHRWTARMVAALAGGLAAFAAVDEITQPWFSRAAEALDWACDCGGIAGGLAAVTLAVLIVRVVRERYVQLGVGGR